jgi:predicted nucleic acid-binding protein
VIVLDTNVVSELMRAEPATAVVEWIDRQPAEEVWLTSVTLGELLYGVGRLPAGRRKTELAARVEAMVAEDLDHRVAAFDEAAAAHYADIVVVRERAGRPISAADAEMAAICRSHGALLATRNIEDFSNTGVTLADPWSGQERVPRP